MARPVKDDGKFKTADAWLLLDLLSVINDMTEDQAGRLVSWARGETDFPSTNEQWVGIYVNAAKKSRGKKK